MERAGVQAEITRSQASRSTSSGVLQRQCACGTHTMGGGQCVECQKKKMGVGGRPLQTKLAISAPGDAYEQEADRVAEQVMRLSSADVSRRQDRTMTHPLVQRRTSDSATGLAEAPPIVHDVLNSPGHPLDVATRAFFEPRFGYDFSQVRVHSGAAADQSARNVNAHAYTVGHNVVFGAGRFTPGTNDGKKLLAHELTHVVQQSGAGETNAGSKGRKKLSLTSLIEQQDNNGVSSKIFERGFPCHNSAEATDFNRLLATSTFQLQRYALLSPAALELAAQQAPRVALLLEEYGALVESGAIAAEETVLIGAAAGGTATAIGEGALVATAGLAADDVTGIGVADDLAIPFTLVAGLVGLGIGAGVAYYYRNDISRTLRVAADAVAKVLRLIQEAIRRHGLPKTVPETQPEAQPKTVPENQTETQPKKQKKQKCPYPTGLTTQDPILIQWFKLPSLYPSPIILDGMEYQSDNPTNLPHGEPIGVPRRFWPLVGKIVQLAPDVRDPSITRSFRDVLTSYSFAWGGRRHLQADHVQDLQWSRPDGENLDTFRNLWPYDGAANASAGPLQNNNQPVSFCETPAGPQRLNVPVSSLKRPGGWGRFFVIR